MAASSLQRVALCAARLTHCWWCIGQGIRADLHFCNAAVASSSVLAEEVGFYCNVTEQMKQMTAYHCMRLTACAAVWQICIANVYSS
jgi:hypothetical protein